MNNAINKTILIVDDDRDSLEILTRVLGTMGYRLFAASSGTAALNILDERPVDLVIADYVMAGLDGVELLRQIRKRRIDTKFMIVTAYGEMESYMEVMNLGAVDYLNKPIKHEHLVDVVARAIDFAPSAHA